MQNDAIDFLDDDITHVDDTDALTWRVLIVDDEQSIHDITMLALNDVEYEGRRLEFFHAYSSQNCIDVLKQNDDIAIVLLDVVMETDTAGLDAAVRIRNELKNRYIRIILRTGQPGQAPEHHVIRDYDINDYKEKTELTSKKLYTTMITALRSYRDIVLLDRSRQGLEKVIHATSKIFKEKSLEKLVSGVLLQVLSVMGLYDKKVSNEVNSLIALNHDYLDDNEEISEMVVVSGTGHYEESCCKKIKDTLPLNVIEDLQRAINNKENIYSGDGFIIYLNHNSLIYIDAYKNVDEIEEKLLDIFCANISVAFENSELHEELLATQREIINTLGSTTEFRSNETGNHVVRVAEVSKILALAIGMPEDEAEKIRCASPMHDIGKIGIPDKILLKPGKLTAEEFEIIKSHTVIGYEILKASKRPILKAASIIALQHQEKWDGTGYPKGLKGDDIHIYGRLTAVADVFDALCSKRCYKEKWSYENTLDYMKSQSGLHFDPEIIDKFIECFDDIMTVRKLYAD